MHSARTHAPLLGLAALGLAAAFPQTAHAQATYTFTGTTVGSPTYNRPLAGTPPTGLSAVGTAVHYSVFTFTVTTPGSYAFLSKSLVPANWDNFTFLYGGTFTPATPLTNALIGNDDNPSIGLSGFTYTLNTTTTYTFVTTGFSNTDAGTFTNTITSLAAAPEPSAWAGLAVGALGLGALTVRARRRALPA